MRNAVSRDSRVANQMNTGAAEGRRQPTKKPPSYLPAFSPNGPLSDVDEVAFLRLPEVKAMTGLSKSSLYALIKEKGFPAPVRLGARTVAWVKSEVRQWAAARIQASRSAA